MVDCKRMFSALKNMVRRWLETEPASSPCADSRPAIPLHDQQQCINLVQDVRDYGIFLLDPGGCVMSWNAGAELIKGYR